MTATLSLAPVTGITLPSSSGPGAAPATLRAPVSLPDMAGAFHTRPSSPLEGDHDRRAHLFLRGTGPVGFALV